MVLNSAINSSGERLSSFFGSLKDCRSGLEFDWAPYFKSFLAIAEWLELFATDKAVVPKLEVMFTKALFSSSKSTISFDPTLLAAIRGVLPIASRPLMLAPLLINSFTSLIDPFFIASIKGVVTPPVALGVAPAWSNRESVVESEAAYSNGE